MKCNTIKGTGTSILVQKETEFGKTVTGDFIEFKRNSFKLDESQNEIKSDTVSNNRAQNEFTLGRQDLNGDLEVPLDDNVSNIFLEAVFGNKVSTPVGDTVEHVFNVTDTCTNSLQFEEINRSSGLVYRSRGIKLGSMDVEFDIEGQTNVKYGMMGDFKQMQKIGSTSNILTVEADAVAGATVIDVLDVSNVKVGDVVTLPLSRGTVEGDHNSNLIKISEVNGFSVNDFLMIGNEEVQVQGVEQDYILISRIIKVLNGTDIVSLNNSYIVTEINVAASTLTFSEILVNDVAQNQAGYVIGASDAKTGVYFDNARASFSSSNTAITSGDVEKMSFTFGNALEKVKTIGETKITEGITESEMTLDLILTRKSALLLESSKNGSSIDISVDLTNKAGSKFKLELFNCQIVPASPDLSIPTLAKVQIKAKPTLRDGKYITCTLVNKSLTV